MMSSLNSIVKRERISNDVHVNKNGRELLSICKLNDLFIFNRRIGTSPECSYTCNTPQGSSVVDDIIGDGCMLSYVAKFNINKFTPLSDHCSITVHLKCLSEKKYDIMMDNRKANVRYK